MDSACIFHELRRLAGSAAVPGAQLAIHHDGTTWTCELGAEEHGNDRLLTRDSKIPIGSISKTFTATLAMMLVCDGDLDLDTPIPEYLPDLRTTDAERFERLTLRHLLSHTGGLPSDPEHASTTSRRRHVLDSLRHLRPLYEPGHAFSYSNFGYVMAGHLIEAVTGMSWSEAMEAVLLRPLALSPAFVAAPGPTAPTATGHAVNPALGRVRPVRQSLAPVDAPAGAIAASASDLVVLGKMLAGAERSELIEPEAVERMREPVPGAEPFGVADGWGLGLARFRDGDRVWVGHDGNADGTSCHLRIDPEGGTVVALTTNGSTGIPVWHELVAELREMGLAIGDYHGIQDLKRQPAEHAEHAACTGLYENGDIEYVVHQDGDHLTLSVDGEPFGELTLYDGLVFTIRDTETGESDQTGRFMRDTRRGRVDWIQVGGRLARRRDRVRDVA